ncbi:toluene transporter subunit: membrane component of ABC superfamily [Burkholderiales bacterium]|jgi:phospholipid/cholesterol/gamma-HCH transport system substrate-binding protein|nr:toluene transporter subunit: membrane component of ABC superfamily [Burkholderiales bacterium]
MTKRQTETLVGLFVVLGMLAILFLALKAANLTSFSFDATYPLLARFDNVGGLKVGSPVKSAGVTIGRVASISFDNKSFQGLVTMQIERKYDFPTDSSAKILTAGLLGDQYVGVDPGGEDKNLQPGDTIKMVQSAVILENLIGQVLYSKAAEGPSKESTNKK